MGMDFASNCNGTLVIYMQPLCRLQPLPRPDIRCGESPRYLISISCDCASICALRNKYAPLLFETSSQTKVSLVPTGHRARTSYTSLALYQGQGTPGTRPGITETAPNLNG
eukprot:1138708-Pelagomonas_calceolata.AAC.2